MVAATVAAAGATSEAPAVPAEIVTDTGLPADEGKMAPPPAPVESRTVQLSKRVEAEGEAANSRAQRMADLSSELKR